MRNITNKNITIKNNKNIKNNTKINVKNKYKNTSSKGGKVLASGGFGCVFSPALKCEGETKRHSNQVSKLMSEKHATEEYEEIISIKEKVKNISNYENYFLLYDMTLCRPAKLSKPDLTNFSKKCTALPKMKITTTNINSNLDKLLLLNMPNGGIPVDDYLFDNGSYDKIYHLHIKLVNLLKTGIIPMNSKNIYHNDIKDSNILVDNTDFNVKTRLIDWGLATEYVPFKNNPFPKNWRNRPLQFNVPFSVIIFSEAFIEQYTNFLNTNINTNINTRPFVVNYINFWMKERGAGHYKFINEIMYTLFSNSLTNISEENKPKIIETEFTMNYIVNYIISILKKYTKFRENGTLNLREYLDHVFIKNIDIWGFITVYFPILELLHNNYDKLNSDELKLFEILKNIFVNYLYLSADKPINTASLFKEFKKFGDIINKLRIRTKDGEKSDTNHISKDVASGIKTKKHRIKKTHISFKRKPKQKRFKKPIFLSIK
jgi:serine/threonine protein kinase